MIALRNTCRVGFAWVAFAAMDCAQAHGGLRDGAGEAELADAALQPHREAADSGLSVTQTARYSCATAPPVATHATASTPTAADPDGGVPQVSDGAGACSGSIQEQCAKQPWACDLFALLCEVCKLTQLHSELEVVPNDCGGKSIVSETLGGSSRIHYDASGHLIGSLQSSDAPNLCGTYSRALGVQCAVSGEPMRACELIDL